MFFHRSYLTAIAASSSLLALAATAKEVKKATLRTLVIVDEDNEERDKKIYSELYSDLKDAGHDITFAAYNDLDLKLEEYGEWLYDNIIINANGINAFPVNEDRRRKFKSVDAEMREAKSANVQRKGISMYDLVDFVDKGNRSIVINAGRDTNGNAFRKLVNEFGFELYDQDSSVVDHFHFVGDDHTIVWTQNFYAPRVTHLNGVKKDDKILFGRGIAHSLSPNNRRVFPVIKSSRSAYSEDSNEQVMMNNGAAPLDGLNLVSALQARNGARVLLVGSKDICANKIATSMRHHKVGEEEAPYMYTEGDDITFEIQLEELTMKGWTPYTTNDMQLEYTMLDPHIRAFLIPDKSTKGLHTLTFKAPDVYGIFKFVVNYDRLGLNPLHIEEVAPLRNYKHNDYPRFLFCAYPYYASVFVAAFGLFVVAFLMIYDKDTSSVAPSRANSPPRKVVESKKTK
ncbi:hypothetical protein FOL47_010019 [Perkinsus chesapeaki]|uniref:Dolichyl-diphosphooligosaccharide--protein glycosyltransferase 48 kDa subunit n=1 Tax=Perkinsus chesapeaki TaxID=330153 RepID=A0A7J6MRK4_PERCH|nr:hypothetical protein FOL47_010019 [Perkinsus chesapeaki]